MTDDDDPDTEPIRVPVPPPAEPVPRPWLHDPSAAPRSFDTGQALRRAGLIVAAASVVIALAAAGMWWWQSGDSGASEAPPATQPATPAPEVTALLELVAPRHPSGRCMVATGNAVECSDEATVPATVARYEVLGSASELTGAFDAVVDDLDVMVCPGNIQSPGPWVPAGSKSPAGIVVCGSMGEIPTVAWTTTPDRLLSVVSTDPGRGALDRLYRWWSHNS